MLLKCKRNFFLFLPISKIIISGEITSYSKTFMPVSFPNCGLRPKVEPAGEIFLFCVSLGVVHHSQRSAGAELWMMHDDERLHPRTFSNRNCTFLRQLSIGKSRRVTNLDKDSLCLSASTHFGSSLLLSFCIINCLRLAVWGASHIRRRFLHWISEALTDSTDGCDTTGCRAVRHQVAEFRAAGGHVTLTGLCRRRKQIPKFKKRMKEKFPNVWNSNYFCAPPHW